MAPQPAVTRDSATTLQTVSWNAGYRKIDDVDVGEARSVADLVALATKIEASAQSYALMWYRGSIDADAKLSPRLHRYDLVRERTMYGAFLTRAKANSRESVPRTGTAGWAAVMEYHCLPTRLLAWSTSLLIAAYFVIWRDLEDQAVRNRPGAIWVTIPGILNFNLTGIRDLYGLCDPLHFESFFGASERSGLICDCIPDYLDDVIRLQQTNYTMHDNITPLEDIPNARRALRRIIIPSEARQALARELRMCGFSRASVFPDLTNLGREIELTTAPAKAIPVLDECETQTILDQAWFADDAPPFRYPGQKTKK